MRRIFSVYTANKPFRIWCKLLLLLSSGLSLFLVIVTITLFVLSKTTTDQHQRPDHNSNSRIIYHHPSSTALSNSNSNNNIAIAATVHVPNATVGYNDIQAHLINKNTAIQNNKSILFIHIPKTAGTSFTAILRRIQCYIDPVAHGDCCRNPGSCYYRGSRTCRSIIGCVSHYPRW